MSVAAVIRLAVFQVSRSSRRRPKMTLVNRGFSIGAAVVDKPLILVPIPIVVNVAVIRIALGQVAMMMVALADIVVTVVVAVDPVTIVRGRRWRRCRRRGWR